MEKADRFAPRLRELRVKKGLTQSRLAELSGVGQQTISQLEQGIQAPVWPTLLAIADALGVKCEAFCDEPAGDVEAPKRGRPVKAEAEIAPPSKKAKGKK